MARDSEPAIELERFLPYRLSILSNAVSGAIAVAYRDRFSLSVPEWRVIAVLARFPGIAATEVAGRTRMDAVAVSRAVARLQRAGRIRRAMDREDRRRSQLRLSPAGLAVYRAIAPLALRFEQELLATLSPRELAVLDRALDRLLRHADAVHDATRTPARVVRRSTRRRTPRPPAGL